MTVLGNAGHCPINLRVAKWFDNKFEQISLVLLVQRCSGPASVVLAWASLSIHLTSIVVVLLSFEDTR